MLEFLIPTALKVLNHSKVNLKSKFHINIFFLFKISQTHHLNLLREAKNEMLVMAQLKPKFLSSLNW